MSGLSRTRCGMMLLGGGVAWIPPGAQEGGRTVSTDLGPPDLTAVPIAVGALRCRASRGEAEGATEHTTGRRSHGLED